MEEERETFEQIVDRLGQEEGVTPGRMMSSPGIKYKNKVFAFYWNQEMTFKLGKDFQPETFQLKSYQWLSPFKNKPPMKAWFQIPYTEHEKWEGLAHHALEQIRKELK